ncbi:MAG: rhodanese-like domain-containing protein [Bacteroidales bacterium]
MKERYFSLFIFILICLFFVTGCRGKKTENKQEIVQQVSKPVAIGNETTLLLKDLKENGDYVNSKVFPSLIKASIVNESLGRNILVVDLRSTNQYAEGHIKGAVNKKIEEVPSYFETGIKPFEYDKIIMVSEDGQVSSYVTCLLRLMGYGNVYSMRWGMSAWNIKYSKEGWFKGVSGKYETKLENTVNGRPALLGMPELKTGLMTGPEIGAARFHTLFAEGTTDIMITADEVFSHPQNYYIINLDRKDKYEAGHIPGSVRYKPEGTLGYTDEMATIPSDRPVVVYCGTGHNSGFATAYLRLFGYDARTLKYGNNGFMYNKMVKERTALSWLPFTSDDVNNFEVVK